MLIVGKFSSATYYVNKYPHKLPCYGLCTGVAFPAKIFILIQYNFCNYKDSLLH